MAKGALHVENQTGGGVVPDGEYTITVEAKVFDYGGRGPEVPAGIVTYTGENGEFIQGYAAGKTAVLKGDGKSFESLGKGSNFSLWLGSIIAGGYPEEQMESDVTVFNGCRVQTKTVAQEKRAGLTDQKDGKTIILIDKVLTLPGKGKPGRPTAATTAAKTTTPAKAAPTSKPSASATSANGQSGDEVAIAAVQTALANVDGNTMTLAKLQTSVFLAALKAKVPAAEATALKKAITPDWTVANAEAGGWSSDGETIQLGGE